MKITKFLIVNHRGNITIREREPRLAGNEIAVRLHLDIPAELFARPVLHADLTIPDKAVPSSTINANVIDNVERLIKEATGLEMAITIVPPDTAEV